MKMTKITMRMRLRKKKKALKRRKKQKENSPKKRASTISSGRLSARTLNSESLRMQATEANSPSY